MYYYQQPQKLQKSTCKNLILSVPRTAFARSERDHSYWSCGSWSVMRENLVETANGSGIFSETQSSVICWNIQILANSQWRRVVRSLKSSREAISR